MKCSTMSAVVLCGVLAFAVTGCRYDDPEGTGDDQAVSSELASEADPNAGGSDVASNVVDPNAQETSLDAATGVPFDQDPNYTRCTDVDFAPIYFGFDASNLASSELAKAEAVAQHLKANPGRVVIVEGNCDERGSNEYNLSLGDLRAVSVRDYLLQIGIEDSRIQTKSYGEEKPAVQGQGESAWSKNRRGEFAVFQHK